MQIAETVKAHPGLTIGIVAGVALLAYLLSGSSSGAPVAGLSSGDNVEAATAVQNAQLQASSQNAQINAALQAHTADTAAALELGRINAATSVNNNEILASVETSKINAALQLGSLTSTLQSRANENAQNQETERLRVSTGSATEQQRILADALITQSNNQANVSRAYIQSAENVQTQSLWDKFFG